jgi:hypothetical protein
VRRHFANPAIITHDLLVHHLRNSLSEIWEDRKVQPPNEDSEDWRAILDDISGEHDACMFTYFHRFTGYLQFPLGHNCGASNGVDLWNETSEAH